MSGAGLSAERSAPTREVAEARAPPTPLTGTLPFKAGARAHPAPPFGGARGGRGAGSAGSARAGAGRRRGRRERG